jgi:Cu/Ag efflux protein CusF
MLSAFRPSEAIETLSGGNRELTRIGEYAMKGVIALAPLSALAFLLSIGVAAADEAKGTVISVNEQSRTIVLDDGAMYTLGEGISSQTLQPGDEVLVSFEEQAGQKVVTEVKKAE